jgi:signal recognition particle subunit SRP9
LLYRACAHVFFLGVEPDVQKKKPTKQCIKFKTHSSIFLGRFEALNRSLIQKMTNSRPPLAVAPAPAVTLSPSPAQASAAASPVLQGSNLPGAPGPAAGGGVKKKKGKKK